MDTSAAVRLIEHVSGEVREVRLIGGEPMLHPEWDRIGEWPAFHGDPDYERREHRRCTTMERWGFVDPAGRVHPCLNVEVGNASLRPFLEIWNGRRFRAFRRLVRGLGRLPFCQRCPG